MPQNKAPAKINVLAPASGAVTALLNDNQQNLAIEMAAQLETPGEILKRYSMTKPEFKVLAATDKFKEQFKSAKIAWGSALNAKERVTLKAAMISEGALLKINQLIHDADTPPSNVIAAHQHISTLGSLMPSKGGPEGDAGAKHSISINLHMPDSSPKVIQVQGEVIEHEEEV